MGRVVPNMARVDQRDEYVDVNKKSHGVSSRSALTISGVTITLGLRTGSSGTPFRSPDGAGGRSALRANSDTT